MDGSYYVVLEETQFNSQEQVASLRGVEAALQKFVGEADWDPGC